MNQKQARSALHAMGYRLLGRDPYHDYQWHVARWIDDGTASVTVGWATTLKRAVVLAKLDQFKNDIDIES